MSSSTAISSPRRLAGPAPLVVAAVATLALLIVQALVRHEATPHGDDLIYERMADHPFATHTFPFGYRVGVPLIVHVLPFSHRASFTLLALVCAGAAAGFLYALMTTLGTPARLGAVAAIAFAISPGVLLVLLRNGRNVDAATLLVMSAAALFIVRRQAIPLAVTLLLGAFVRESTLFMVPFAYAVWAERWLDVRALRSVLLAGLPAIAAYVALRLSIPTVGMDRVVGYGHGFWGGRSDVVSTGLEDWKVALRRVFLAFGPLWLLYPLALRGMRYARCGLVLLALCVVAMTYALDWGRVLLLAAPAIYPAAGWVLARRGRAWQVAVLASWIAIAVGYAVYMDRSGVVHNIDGGGAPTYPIR